MKAQLNDFVGEIKAQAGISSSEDPAQKVADKVDQYKYEAPAVFEKTIM